MATTPPRRSRVHTPPTPLHGARYDAYEPYSPRRSTRVAAQRKPFLSSNSTPPKTHRSVRASTPTGSRKQTAGTSSQTFSPPSSPSSPSVHSAPKSPRSVPRRRVNNGLRKHQGLHFSDSDDMPAGDASTTSHLSVLDSRGMLPTPVKTPRKRNLQNSAIASTARVLFPSRPATIEDAMPTPRKSRKGKKNAFTLQSFAEGDDEDEEKIEIYTDTKERIPSLDPDEDNPFITRSKNGKTKASASIAAPEPKRRKISPSEEERVRKMEEKARNNEGMIYVFRGRKLFRKFDDASASSGSDDDTNLAPTTAVRRQVGAAASRPFTRSTIQPRLLFPNEEQRREREAAQLAEEEATTDIEVPVPIPSSTRKGKGRVNNEASTPVKSQFSPATPPSTGRARRTRQTDAVVDEPEEHMELDVQSEEEIRTPVLPQQKAKGKKTSPFDSWQRVKPTARAVSGRGAKREGDVLEGTGKRVRNGASGI
ncbi:uncharacterized protein BDZ99DRAFT_410503 [Mytilinidion resinicola]|uniref:Uncharacterized protein n=1 Tax=Mytilinidion resinicola TaxID=574789 RepID=A0A6A6Z1Q5_9PEZI|nr:uncharacterized protein BDZ99DRAFT_410503 [Mytilinidion resinicola]KAF2814167.1 hypothetical protein BDZ99DRAFT_410503 [Mytilinidion resinicola]